MFFNKGKKIKKENEKKEKLTRPTNKFENMTNEQLIMAMLLEVDSGNDQYLAMDTVLGKEAIKRSGYNPFDGEDI